MSATPDGNPIFATISSKVLHAFGPILRSAAEDAVRFRHGALFVYPHDEGALCIATDGVVLAAYLDRSGRTNQPAQFRTPERLLAACAPVTPVMGMYQGWSEPLPMPEWMQPNAVMLFGSGAVVFPAMPHPIDAEDPENGHVLLTMGAADGNTYRSGDFRASEPKFDPRAVLTKVWATPSAGPIHMNPLLVVRFAACFEAFGLKSVVHFTSHGDDDPISLLFHACPDFIGLIMPMKTDVAPMPPAFVTALREEVAARAEPTPVQDAA